MGDPLRYIDIDVLRGIWNCLVVDVVTICNDITEEELAGLPGLIGKIIRDNIAQFTLRSYHYNEADCEAFRLMIEDHGVQRLSIAMDSFHRNYFFPEALQNLDLLQAWQLAKYASATKWRWRLRCTESIGYYHLVVRHTG